MDAPRNDFDETASAERPRSRGRIAAGVAVLVLVAAVALAGVLVSTADDRATTESSGATKDTSADATATPSGRVERATFAMG